MSKVESFAIFHLIWMSVILATNDYQSLQFDVPSERNVYEEFFISVAFNALGFVQSPLPGFEDEATRILHLKVLRFSCFPCFDRGIF